MDQDLSGDPSSRLNHVGERGLRAEELPIAAEEDDGPGCDEFLKGPAAVEPLALADPGPLNEPLVVEA